MAQKFVFAKKGNQVKKFLETTWNLLKDKNGWVLVDTETIGKKAPEQKVKILKPKKEAPPTGQVVKNEVVAPAPETVVENNIEGAQLAGDAEKTAADTVVNEVSTDSDTDVNNASGDADATGGDVKNEVVVEESVKQELIDHIKANLTKGQLKDLFDKENVAYTNAMNHAELADILAKSFNYSKSEFDLMFNIAPASNTDL